MTHHLKRPDGARYDPLSVDRFRSDHSAIAAVLEAARALVAPTTAIQTRGEQNQALYEALFDLDHGDGHRATQQEVEEATRTLTAGDNVEVGGPDALASHGEDGVWISGWILIPRITP